MRSDWIDYPLSAVSTAISSTVGGVVTFTAALSLGTLAGNFVIAGVVPWAFDVELVFYVFAFAEPILLSIFELWGFLYLGLLTWFGHALVRRDAPRLRTAGLMMFLQFLVTLCVARSHFHYDHYYHYEDHTKLLTRTLCVGGLLSLCALPTFIAWLRSLESTTLARVWRLIVGTVLVLAGVGICFAFYTLVDDHFESVWDLGTLLAIEMYSILGSLFILLGANYVLGQRSLIQRLISNSLRSLCIVCFLVSLMIAAASIAGLLAE